MKKGKTKEMYPFILGDYKQIRENPKGFLKIGQPKMFLLQPETLHWGLYLGGDKVPGGKVGLH